MIEALVDYIIKFFEDKYKIELSKDDVIVRRTKNHQTSDYSSNIFLVRGSFLGITPSKLAKEFLEYSDDISGLELTVGGPGFLNIKILKDQNSSNCGELIIENLSLNNFSEMNYLINRLNDIINHYKRWNIEVSDSSQDSLLEIEVQILTEIEKMKLINNLKDEDISHINRIISKYLVQIVFNSGDYEYKAKRYKVLREILKFYGAMI